MPKILVWFFQLRAVLRLGAPYAGLRVPTCSVGTVARPLARQNNRKVVLISMGRMKFKGF